MARQLNLRRPGTCATCARELAVGESAAWDRPSRSVRCPSCAEFRAELDQGLPPDGGAPDAGWTSVAAGDRLVAPQLAARMAARGVVLLHDRRIPGSRATIDHVAVGPSGVFVIDAENFRGRIQVRRDGGLMSVHRERLLVKGHDETRLVDQLLEQVDVVQTALETLAAPVRGVLCFVKGDWPLFGGADRIRGVEICWPRRAAHICSAPGPLSPADVDGLAERLARALPAA